jgi:hypothetical protein
MVACRGNSVAGAALCSGWRCIAEIQGRDRGQVLAEYEDGGTGYSLVRKYIYGSYIDELGSVQLFSHIR